MDSRDRRDGAYIEQLGIYQPKRQPSKVLIQEEKALEWLHRGAIPSDTVRTLLSQNGLMLRFDLMKRNTAPDKIEEAVAKWREDMQVRAAKRAEKGERKRKVKTAEATPAS
jgi:small subunit ribosomal protein S16